MLAPLLAGMSLPDPTLRLTAEQALQFYHDRRAELTLEQLHAPIASMKGWKQDYLDPWEGLDAEFVAQWAQFHARPLSLLTRTLRYICQWHWTYVIVAKVRQGFDWAVLLISTRPRIVRPSS